jgi:threonine dehydrogenase-like Zn-dependent dehydrogenase
VCPCVLIHAIESKRDATRCRGIRPGLEAAEAAAIPRTRARPGLTGLAVGCVGCAIPAPRVARAARTPQPLRIGRGWRRAGALQQPLSLGATKLVNGSDGQAVELRLERLWSHNITLTTRLVDTVTTSMPLKLVAAGKLEPSKLVTHRYALKSLVDAYEVFASAARERALNVVLTNR